MNKRQVPQVHTVRQTGKAPQVQFLINQVTKHAEISQTQYCDKVIAVPIMIQRHFPQLQTVPKTGEAPQTQFLINQVTTHAEISQTQFCDKVTAAMPVVIQRQVPRTQTCLKTVKVLPVPSIGRVANVPVIMQITTWPEAIFNKVTKHVETPKSYFCDQGVGVPLAIQRQVPRIQTVLKTVKFPTAQSVGRVVDVPVIMTIMPLVHKVIEEPGKLAECLTNWTVSCSVRRWSYDSSTTRRSRGVRP